MFQQVLLAVALQQWEEFTPHALTAREVAVALAKGAGAKLSILSVYDYGKIKEPSGLSADMAVRYREDMMQRIDAQMGSKMKAFLADVQGMDLAITPMVQAGEPRTTIVDVAQKVSADLLVIGAHSKRSVLDAMLGGTAAYVSRQAPCPVLMATPRQNHSRLQPRR
jgi:nucleotide-binding universal stress UspA family protein